MSKLGLVKNVIKGAKEAKPFYSAADKAAMELTRGKGTGKEFITELKKAPGVKKAELEHRKLAEIEAMPKMTKEEFLAELEKRPPVQITQTVRRNPTEREWNEIADRLMDEEATRITTEEMGRPYFANREEWNEYQEDVFEGLSKYHREEYLDKAREMAKEGELPETPGYDRPDLRLPGGENYREILLKLPSFRPSIKNMSRADYNKAVEAADKAGIRDYESGHWIDEPNVLSHARVVDRTGPNGEKVLHVEEIQSDWHQAGRKLRDKEVKRIMEERGISKKEASALVPEDFGYKTSKDQRKAIKAEAKNGYFQVSDQNGNFVANVMNHDIPEPTAEAALAEAQHRIDAPQIGRQAADPRVPDAPFKKNWHELTMKRLLNYAAQNGYDKVVITPGAEQAKRYDLSKHVDELLYQKNPDGTYQLSAQIQGRGRMLGEAIPADKLEEHVGKDVAEKIINNEGKETNLGGVGSTSQPKDLWGSLSGLDLQIGGEGMQGFYDKMLPDYLNTYGKKYGVQVGKMPIEAGEEMSRGASGSDMVPTYTPKMVDVHSFDITPEMREDIKGGMPLYQKIGIPTGAGAAGAEMEPEEPGFAGGGIVGEEYDPDQSDGGLVVHDSASFKRGGKVKISDNPDAMFLELRDKELNRK